MGSISYVEAPGVKTNLTAQRFEKQRQQIEEAFGIKFVSMKPMTNGTNNSNIKVVLYKEGSEKPFFLTIQETPDTNPLHGLAAKDATHIPVVLNKLGKEIARGSNIAANRFLDYSSPHAEEMQKERKNDFYPYRSVKSALELSKGDTGLRDRQGELVNVTVTRLRSASIHNGKSNGIAPYAIIKFPHASKPDTMVEKLVMLTEFAPGKTKIYDQDRKHDQEFADESYQSGRKLGGFSKAGDIANVKSLLHGVQPYSPIHMMETVEGFLKTGRKAGAQESHSVESARLRKLVNIGLGVSGEATQLTYEKDEKKHQDNEAIENALKDPEFSNRMLQAGTKYMERIQKATQYVLNNLPTPGQKLQMGLVQGDPYYDNEMHTGTGAIFQLDTAGMGWDYRINEQALGVSSRNGIDMKTGKLNAVGKAYLRGYDEVIPLDKDFKEHFYTASANVDLYIALMRTDKYASGAFVHRSPVPQLEKAEKTIEFHKQKTDLGLDEQKDLTPLSAKDYVKYKDSVSLARTSEVDPSYQILVAQEEYERGVVER